MKVRDDSLKITLTKHFRADKLRILPHENIRSKIWPACQSKPEMVDEKLHSNVRPTTTGSGRV